MSLLLKLSLVFTNAVLNTVGAYLLTLAKTSNDPLWAILGCLCWAGTAAAFIGLLRIDGSLAVVSSLTAAAGLIAVLLMGVLLFGDQLAFRQWIAFYLLIVSIVLLA